jgi:magnesium-transporting ATPase (P-type)
MQAIVKLRAAGIRVWMLTGDKYTTAIQIATSCNLIDGEPDTLLTVSGVDEFEVRSSISTHLEHIKKHGHSKVRFFDAH